MSCAISSGPLYPGLFAPDPAPSLAVDEDAPCWRAEILDIHVVWLVVDCAQDMHMLQREMQLLAARTGADHAEILGVQRQACCGPLGQVQVGYTYHLDVVADSSHEALAIAERIARQRWPGSEVVGVDLVPEGGT